MAPRCPEPGHCPRYEFQARNLRIPSLKAFRDLVECPLSDGFPGQPRPRLTYTPTPATTPDNGWLCNPDMTHLTAMTTSHATDRLADWQTALRAENKSPGHPGDLRRRRHPLPALVCRSRPPADE